MRFNGAQVKNKHLHFTVLPLGIECSQECELELKSSAMIARQIKNACNANDTSRLLKSSDGADRTLFFSGTDRSHNNGDIKKYRKLSY